MHSEQNALGGPGSNVRTRKTVFQSRQKLPLRPRGNALVTGASRPGNAHGDPSDSHTQPINATHTLTNPHTRVICFCLHNSTWCGRLNTFCGLLERTANSKGAGSLECFYRPLFKIYSQPSVQIFEILGLSP